MRPGRGSDASISWNFRRTSPYTTHVYRGRSIVRAVIPPRLVIAHELTHAWRQMLGIGRTTVHEIQGKHREHEFMDEPADPENKRGMIWSAPEEREVIDRANRIHREQGIAERVGHREQPAP